MVGPAPTPLCRHHTCTVRTRASKQSRNQPDRRRYVETPPAHSAPGQHLPTVHDGTSFRRAPGSRPGVLHTAADSALTCRHLLADYLAERDGLTTLAWAFEPTRAVET